MLWCFSLTGWISITLLGYHAWYGGLFLSTVADKHVCFCVMNCVANLVTLQFVFALSQWPVIFKPPETTLPVQTIWPRINQMISSPDHWGIMGLYSIWDYINQLTSSFFWSDLQTEGNSSSSNLINDLCWSSSTEGWLRLSFKLSDLLPSTARLKWNSRIKDIGDH